MADIYRIPFLLALILNVCTQLQKSGGYCLENCANCLPTAISNCIGNKPCQQGFYIPKDLGVCKILPSLQISYEEMNRRTRNVLNGLIWGQDSKLTKCIYEQKGLKQQIDVLGMFQGSKSLKKQFKLPKGGGIVEIRFSLVRDDWLPFNDFLSIEIVNDSDILKTYEISYQQRINLTSYEINVKCGEKKVIIQRYTLKIDKQITKNLINNTLKVIFNSFLFDSVWGMTNFQILTGCVGFTKYNQKIGQCDSCDSNGYYLDTLSGYNLCKKCPQMCKTCISQEKCVKCYWGSLVNGRCQVSQAYKFQELEQKYFNSTCNIYSLIMSYNQSKILLPLFQNPSNKLYDEVFPVLAFFYDSFDVKKKDRLKNQIVIKINGQIIKRVTLQENIQFLDSCKLFSSQRIAKITIVGPLITVNDNKLLISLQAQGISNFGLGKVLYYSLDKILKDPSDLAISKVSQYEQIVSSKAVSNQQQNVNDKQTILKINTPLLLQSASASSNITNQLVKSLKNDQSPTFFSQKTKYIVSNNASLIVSIFDIPQLTGKIEIQIDRLQNQDFKILDTYFIDGILMLELKIFKSFVQGKFIVKQVTQKRLSQSITAKYLAQIQVSRFVTISESQIQSIYSLEKAFQVFAWFGLLAIIFSITTGFGVIIEEYIITLQLIYLHIYLGYNIFPISFVHSISGLRGVTILDFFNPLVINFTPWPLNSQMLFKLLPSTYRFSYAFLPLLFTLLSYLIWFIALLAVKKWLLPRDIPDQSRGKLHKIVDRVVCRVMNYVDTIWRYQLIAAFLLCFRQFNIFKDQAESGQLTFAIIVLITYLGWCLFSEYYVRQQYYQCQYRYFLFKFEDRFFCRIPQHSLPSRHHRLGYPLLRMAKALVFVVLTFLPIPIVAILVCITINTFEIWYIYSNFIFSESRMLKFKLIQGILFVILELVMLIMVSAQNQIGVEKYIGWGFFLASIALLIIINGLLRVVFSIWLKYMHMKDVNFQEVELDKKLQVGRAV